MIRLLIADDEPLVCQHLTTILSAQSDIEVVGHAADGAEAVELTVRLRPDLVLMDIRMPGVDGIQATRRIAQLNPRPVVVALTTFDADTSVLGALQAGANGFLLKSTAPDSLADLIRTAAKGHTVMSPEATAQIARPDGPTPQGGPIASGAAATATTSPSAGGPDDGLARLVESLTEREREVLELIAGGLSNAEIAARLCLSSTTVKGYVSRVLDKLGCSNRTQAGLIGFRYLRQR